MIIGKAFKRILALALCLLCVAQSVACSRSTDSALEALGTLPDEEETVALYRIVISGMCNSSVYDAAHRLADGLADKIGIECVVIYDSESVSNIDGAVEIALGNVDRPQETEKMSNTVL